LWHRRENSEYNNII